MLIIIGSVALAAAIVLAFMPRSYASAVAWVGLLLYNLAGTPYWTGLIFWGVAALLVAGIAYLQGPGYKPNRTANAYITAGALVGAIVGMIISSTAIVLGAVVGAFFGIIAFSRTPRGSVLSITNRSFWTVLLAIGLPAVIAMGITGIAAEMLLAI